MANKEVFKNSLKEAREAEKKIDYSKPISDPGTNINQTSINQASIAPQGYAHTHTYTSTASGNFVTSPGYVTYGNYQQYPPNPYATPTVAPYPPGTVQFVVPPTSEEFSAEDRELAIEFIENLMLLIVSRLDECDVHNEGGSMDRSDYAILESRIDLGEYEIIIKPKNKTI